MVAGELSKVSDVVDASSCVCRDGVLMVTVRGVPESTDYVRLVEACYPKFDFKHALWDFRNSSASGLSYAAFDPLAEVTAHFDKERGEGSKTAVLVRSDLDRLLFSAFAESKKETLTCEMRAFFDEDEAWAWLKD